MSVARQFEASADLALVFAVTNPDAAKKRRRTFGRPIIEHQAIAFQIADMATSLHAAELMVLKAAHQRNAEQSASTDTAVTKLFASEITEQVCNNAIQIHGGLGYLTDCPPSGSIATSAPARSTKAPPISSA